MTIKNWVACAALAALCLLSACGAPPAPCGPSTCKGCCDSQGVCQRGSEVLSCGLDGRACFTCGLGLTCHAAGVCLSIPPVEAPDAGGSKDEDGGADAGMEPPDAGPIDAGAPDAGPSCAVGLLSNPGFECGLDGWTVLEGDGQLAPQGWEGQASLELWTDTSGRARVGLTEPLRFTQATTLCLAVRVRGTVPNVRLEALVTPANQGVTFGAPVEGQWTQVPPSMLRVLVPAQSQVYVLLRAHDAASGQWLQVDGVEATLSTTGQCGP